MGLPGNFFFDDFSNIVQNTNIHTTELSINSIWDLANSGFAGPLKRPIPTISFGINYYFSGLSPYAFKLTNIIIHLINGVLLFALLKQIFIHSSLSAKINTPNHRKVATYTAFFASIIWLIHPLHVSGVLYIVQRMNLMAGTFSLIALICYCHGRIHLINQTSIKKGGAYIFSCLLFILLSAFCKENGTLTIILAFIIEIFFFRFISNNKKQRNLIISFFVIFLAIPVSLFLYKAISNPEWITNGYINREFSFTERILTQPRILFYYIKLTLLPSITELSFFHDDIETSKSLLQPITTILAIICLALAAIAPAIFARKNFCVAIISFGILWFLSGHILESSVFSLEMVYEHRNYIPAIGIITCATFPSLYLLDKKNILNSKAIAIMTIVIISLTSITALRSKRWSSSYHRNLAWTLNHPKSPKSHFDLAHSYIKKSKKPYDSFFNLATNHLLISAQLNPNSQISLLALIRLHSETGDNIKTEWINNATKRLSEKPLHTAISIQFTSIYKCLALKKCNNPKIFEQLINTAINNKKSTKRITGILYTIRGEYHFNIKKDSTKGTYDYYLATKSDPTEIKHHLSLIRLLSLSKNFKQARHAIKILQDNDLYKTNALIIEEASELINKDEKNSQFNNQSKN